MSEAGPSKKIKIENCPDGLTCDQKTPEHFNKFEHPHLFDLVEMADVQIPESYPQDKNVYLEQIAVLRSLLKSKPSVNVVSTSTDIPSAATTMLEKLKNAAPYNVFFTTIPMSPETLKQPNSVTFTDLLCPSLGTLKWSLQINFLIDLKWLMEQYKARNLEKKPLTLLHGNKNEINSDPHLKEYSENVNYEFVTLKDNYGCHHSKIGLYLYEDNSLRVVVSTANLQPKDWERYNQGLWISPTCPPLSQGHEKSGESPTNFKSSLLQYLEHYNLRLLQPWIAAVTAADFSDVRVILVTSVPGKHLPESSGCHVNHVGHLLSQHCTLPKKTGPESEGPLDWGVVAQASSIASLGKSPEQWLMSTILRSLGGHNDAQLKEKSKPTLSVIFPSVENVNNGFWKAESGECLSNSEETNKKQRWLQEFLYQWKADGLARTRAIPHIKTYCRISPCLSKLAWFLLTSANLSKAAWGVKLQKDKGVYVRSYEAGVMFLPKFFDEEFFEIKENTKNEKLFPFMYDLPLTKYSSSDEPWCSKPYNF